MGVLWDPELEKSVFRIYKPIVGEYGYEWVRLDDGMLKYSLDDLTNPQSSLLKVWKRLPFKPHPRELIAIGEQREMPKL